MSSRVITIAIVLAIGYFLGIKFPGIGAKIGIA